MSDPFEHKPFPKQMVWAGAALVSFTLAATAVHQLTSPPRDPLPAGEVVSMRMITFYDREDGGIDVYDAEADQMIDVIVPGQGGFTRAMMRGITRQRGAGAEEPFVLSLQDDGRLWLRDPVTQKRIDLTAFGPTQAQAYADWLPPKEGATK